MAILEVVAFSSSGLKGLCVQSKSKAKHKGNEKFCVYYRKSDYVSHTPKAIFVSVSERMIEKRKQIVILNALK